MKSIIFLILICVTLSVACGPSTPKAGHWEGESPAVSFDLTENGTIEQLVIELPFIGSFGNTTCTVSFNTLTFGEERTFVMTQSPFGEGGGFETELEARFLNPTEVSGTYRLNVCSNQLMSPASEGTWRAQWKE